MFCPNFSNKEVRKDFDSLTKKVGENIAYFLWDKYEGDIGNINSDPIVTGETKQTISRTEDVIVSSDFVNQRPKSFTAEQWSEANRIASMLQELYPELDKEYVESLQEGQLGKADLDAMKIFIDFLNQRADTLPHEYAHYYIAMFRNSELVQKGIEQFGSEEALVQAIGEQTVEQKGKVRTWWKKFSQWVLNLFKGDMKQAVLNELTDAFLRRDPVGMQQEVYGKYYQAAESPKTATIDDLRLAIAAASANIVFDPIPHTYTDSKTGTKLEPTTKLKQKFGYDTYDKSLEDEIQSKITKRSSELGSQIHAVFEAMWFNNFNPNSFPGFSKEALADIQAIVDRFREDYDIVGSEMVLGDVDAKVAGAADVLFRNKKTGELVLGDFKTKMLKLNNKAVNEKGTKLRGFLYALSTKFSPKSTRDAYDFQLSVYEHMLNKVLNPFGVKISKRVIIPICFNYTDAKGGTIQKVMISTIFGNDEDTNNQLNKDGFVTIVKKKDTNDTVEHKIFGEPYTEEEKGREEANAELSQMVQRITKKLTAQVAILQKKLRTQTVSKEAQSLLDKIQNLSEIDAIINYVGFADNTLSRLEKQINYRLKAGEEVGWDLDTLTDYRNVAKSYELIQTIPTIVKQFQDDFDENTISEIVKLCNSVSRRISTITSAYDVIGKKLYLEMITPYVGNVRYEMIQGERKEYISKNPKAANETYEQFEERIKKHTDDWQKEHAAEIEMRTKKWLDMQTQIADAGFECNGAAAYLGSVYETKDPFVAAMVKMFDERMNTVQERGISYRAKMNRILKEYRKKYGLSNFSKFKDIFSDFVEISGDKCYLVNPLSTQYIEAEKQAKFEIYSNPDLTFEQKREAYKKWLDENNPISDKEAFEQRLKEEVTLILKGRKKETIDAVTDNLDLPAEKRKSWYTLYKEGKIESYVKDQIEQAEFNLEIQYRKIDKTKYKNEKYNKIMSLPDSDPKKQMLKLLLETVQSIDQNLPKSLRLNYRLPGVQKRGIEINNQDGLLAVISDAASRSITMFADDDIRGVFVDDDGRQISTIPLFYVPTKKITPEEQSFDLPTIFAKWMESALEWKAKSEMESYVLKTQALLATRLTETNKKSAFNTGQRVAQHKTNTETQFNAWVDQVFYGNKLFELGKISSKFSDKVYDVGKIVKSLISLTSQTAMSLNWVAGQTNFVTGEINQLEEVLAAQYGIDRKSYAKAGKIFIENALGLVSDFYRASPDNKLNKLAQWFGVNEVDKNLTISGVLREGLDTYAYLPMRIGDVAMKYRYMLAMLINMRAYDKEGEDIGSMLDYIDFDENNSITVDPKVVNFNRQQQNEFRLKLRRMLIAIHGNMGSDRSLVAAEKHWYGKAGLALRRFIEPNFERRFAEEHYDPFIDAKRAGFARYGAKWVFITNPVCGNIIKFLAMNILRCKQAKLEVQQWKELTDLEKKNVVRFGVELGAMITLYVLSAMIGHAGDDDDDDKNVDDEWMQLLKYISYRVYTDLSFFYLPSSFVKILQDPFPVMSYFNKLSDALLQLFHPFEEYTTGDHLFDNKFLNKTYRLIPGVKQIGRFSNIKSEMQYFIKGN